MLEIRMLSPSPGNLTLVIPRTVLDKLDQNGKDDAFGVAGNKPIGFTENFSTPLSRTIVIQFDNGVNYVQVLGSKTIPDMGQEKPASGSSVVIMPGSSNPFTRIFFNPGILTDSTGTTVTWTNKDNTVHSVTSVNPVASLILFKSVSTLSISA